MEQKIEQQEQIDIEQQQRLEILNKLQRLEKELISYKGEEQDKLVEKVALQFTADIDKYLPRFSLFEDQYKSLYNKVNESLSLQTSNQNKQVYMQQQVDIQRRELEQVKNQVSVLSELSPEEREQRDQVRRMVIEIDDIKFKLKNLASQETIEQIQLQIRGCVPKTLYNLLESKVNECSSKEQFQQLKSSLQEITLKLGGYISQENFNLRMKNIQEQIYQQIDGKLSISQFEIQKEKDQQKQRESILNINKSNDALNRTQARHSKIIEDIKEEIKFIYQSLDQKCEVNESLKIWKNFDKFSTFSDMKALYNKCIPEIDKFEKKIQLFYKELEQSQIIISRFDETLCHKASKLNIKEIYDQLKNYPNKEELQEQTMIIQKQCEQNKENLEQLNENINILGKQLSKDIYQAVKKVIQSQNQIENGESIRLNDNFKQVLNQKADKQDIIELDNQKSNKADTEITLRWIDVLHRQIQQISILVFEQIRIKIEEKQSGNKQNRMSQQQYLLRQAQIICQWIHKFDTGNIESFQQLDYQLPQELMVFQADLQKRAQTELNIIRPFLNKKNIRFTDRKNKMQSFSLQRYKSKEKFINEQSDNMYNQTSSQVTQMKSVLRQKKKSAQISFDQTFDINKPCSKYINNPVTATNSKNKTDISRKLTIPIYTAQNSPRSMNSSFHCMESPKMISSISINQKYPHHKENTISNLPGIQNKRVNESQQYKNN